MVDRKIQLSEGQEAAVRQQLQVILSDEVFLQAERTSRFLKYIVEELLAGRSRNVNQYALATDVFDRDATFDPAIDAIVRVEAGRLRAKLREYYDETGQSDPILILLPKRTYVARIEFRNSANGSDDAAAINVARTDEQSKGLVEPLTTTIAVLAFDNMSGDPEQNYFADGLAEDLITDLSKLPGLSVIARQSSFAYKGSPINMKRVGEELGADYLVEGSVRKANNRVRVNAQLISTSDGSHIWAERFDRNLSDVFDLQDEINANIVRALDLTLRREHSKAIVGRSTLNIEAYDYFLRAMNETRPPNKETWEVAHYCYMRAVELDPGYAAAYAYLSLHTVRAWIHRWKHVREPLIIQAVDWAKHAVKLDEGLAIAHSSLAWAAFWSGLHEVALDEAETANLLNPNDAEALERFAFISCWTDHPDRAIRIVEKLKHLNPSEGYDFHEGLAHFIKADYLTAIRSLTCHIEHYPKFTPALAYLASSFGLCGDIERAMSTVEKLKQLNPNYQLDAQEREIFKNPEDRDRFFEGLRIGGLS